MDENKELKNSMDVILQRVRIAEEKSKSWHDNIKRWRRLYNFDHYFDQGAPRPGEPRFSDPTYTNTVDLAVGIFQANQMRWQAVGFTPSHQEEKDTSKIEKYLAGVLDINSFRNQYNIPYEINLHFVRDGGAVLYTVWDNRLAKLLKTKEGYKEPPILVQVVDPLNIYVLPGGPRRWLAVMHVTEMSVYDLETIYGIHLKKYVAYDINQKMTVRGKYIDYWEYAFVPSRNSTETLEPAEDNTVSVEDGAELIVRNAVLFDDVFIRPPQVMNGYSALPYVISFFKPTDRNNPGEWYNIMQPLETTVRELEKAVNRRQHQIDVFSSLPLLISTDSGRTVRLDPAFGHFQQLGQNDRVFFPEWRGNPPDVREQVDFFRARVQQSGFTDVMYGEGSGALSGYALSQLGDQNRIRLEQPITHLESMWSWWARLVVDLTSLFSKKTPIYVYGKVRENVFSEVVTGEELSGYHIICSIKPEFPNERVRKHAMATQVKGILSEHTIMERYLDIPQPDDEYKRRMIEAAQTHPVVMQYALMETLKNLANEGDSIAQMALQTLQQGMPGQPGRPPEPNNPVQPLGLQSPTGQPVPQAMGGVPPGQSIEEAVSNMANAQPNMMGGVEVGY